MSTISVIIPVYNVEPYLHRCVDSVLAQTFTNFELILVDDGSSDNCGKICDEYAGKDDRIHVIHQENSGLSQARNAGINWSIEKSSSKWLTFVDSDDWIHCQYLELLFRAVQHSGSMISVCKYHKETEYNAKTQISHFAKKKDVVVDFEDFVSKKIEGLNPVTAWCRLFSKSLFREIRFPKGKLHEDLFIIPEIQYNSGQITIVDAVLYYYFYRDTSITGSKWNRRRLDEVEASENLIRFCRERELKKAEKWAIRRYMWVLDSQIKEIESSQQKVERGYNYLCRKRRFSLIKYRKEYPIKNNLNNRYRYEQAFPKMAWLYWECVGILTKIKKIGKEDASN